MEVKSSEWVSKAISNVDKFLHRGGHLQGDIPQFLGGTSLQNLIGSAMDLPLQDPKDWVESELKEALNNRLAYFDGDAKKAIEVIENQIKHCCNCSGSEEIYITVLPIELYYQGKLYELPVFRVHRYENSKKYYVDNIGRSYDSFNDWYNNNVLPPCKIVYPYNLTLMLRPGHNHSRVFINDTPSNRTPSQIANGLDISASVVGISSSIGLLFLSGGFAAPLVFTGLASAIYGTTRTGYQLVDKATHGQNVNPLGDSENRLLWLGIAANLVSFGAMGASMRLASLAASGRNISDSFKIVVNVMNGTNIVTSGAAMADSTAHLIENHDKLSPLDILTHIASIAFWTKGVFAYKTADTLIKTAQDHTFKAISRELLPEDAKKLATIRSQFKNDPQLISEYRRASKSNVSIVTFSQIIIDANTVNGKIQFDQTGNVIFAGGQKYSFEFLGKLPQNVRKNYIDVISNLRTDKIKLLESFRQTVNNDFNLISGLDKVATHYNLTPRQATEQVLNFWGRYSQINTVITSNISIKDSSLVLGRAPPLQVNQLPGLSNSMIRFVGEHLARMDEVISRQWTTTSIPVLLQLEKNGMFYYCQITKVMSTGRAVVLLNESLQISIYKLEEIDSIDRTAVIRLIGGLSPAAATADIPKNTRLLIDKYRLRLESHRRESVKWLKDLNSNEKLTRILNLNLQNFEKDRLLTFKSTVTTAKATPYMSKLIQFISDLNPKNVSEMVSYGEYVITYVEAEKRNLEGEIRSGRLQLPANTKKADFLRQKASDAVFKNPRAMVQKWETTVVLVRENFMVGPAVVKAGLSDDALIAAARRVSIGFGSEASAAYHVLKHPTNPPSAYVQRANEVIRSATRTNVTLLQDGDARLMRFEDSGGSAIVLEREGRVLLCTFSPKSAKP